MEIRIDIQNLIREIVQTNYHDTEGMEDLHLRSLITITEESKDILRQSMVQADAELRLMFARYARRNTSNVSADNQGMPDEELVYDLMLSERQAQGKEIAAAEYVHTYLHNASLLHYYVKVNQPALAEKYRGQAEVNAQDLMVLIESKNPPRYADK